MSITKSLGEKIILQEALQGRIFGKEYFALPPCHLDPTVFLEIVEDNWPSGLAELPASRSLMALSLLKMPFLGGWVIDIVCLQENRASLSLFRTLDSVEIFIAYFLEKGDPGM